MSIKYFTISKANALLPTLTPLLEELLTRRARITQDAQLIKPQLHDLRNNVGSPELSSLTQDFAAIDRLVNQIRGHGVLLKDAQSGLVDFLAERDGRDVYLCWRLGEPEITHYHELHTGFSGRQPI